MRLHKESRRLTVTMEVDVYPNFIEPIELDTEIRDNKKDMVVYFQGHFSDDDWLNGLDFRNFKIKSITQNI